MCESSGVSLRGYGTEKFAVFSYYCAFSLLFSFAGRKALASEGLTGPGDLNNEAFLTPRMPFMP